MKIYFKFLSAVALAVLIALPAVAGVSSNVMVRESKGWIMNKRRKPVHVEIGQDVVVHGDLIFESAVELKLHDSANVGEIISEYVQDEW